MEFLNKFTDEQQTHLSSELEGYVRQPRSLPPPCPCQVSSTFGGACRDHRFGTRPIGPFQDHETFHQFLRRDEDLISFNVIVREGKIMAIGWRPDYWEYTKARYNSPGTHEPWIEGVKRAMGGMLRMQARVTASPGRVISFYFIHMLFLLLSLHPYGYLIPRSYLVSTLPSYSSDFVPKLRSE
jgi:hypothetical protein